MSHSDEEQQRFYALQCSLCPQWVKVAWCAFAPETLNEPSSRVLTFLLRSRYVSLG